MQVGVFTVLLFSVLNKVNTSPTGSVTDDVMHYSCQDGSREGMYGCYDTSVLTPESIKYMINDILEKELALYKAIDNSTEAVTKATVLQPMLEFDCTKAPILQSLVFLHNVADTKEIRQAAESLIPKMVDYNADISFMKNIFNKLKQLNVSTESWNATAEEARYVMRFLRDKMRGGIELEEEQQATLKRLYKGIVERSTMFARTINEYSDTLTFSAASLPGVSAKFLDTLTKDDDGNYIVEPNSPHYSEIMNSCEMEGTRRLVYTARSNRGQPGNNKLLQELVKLRKEVASILGYSSHVDFVTEVLMAESSEVVKNFLEDLATKLWTKLETENEDFLRVKLDKCKESGDICSEELQMWDLSFLTNAIKRDKYTLDEDLIKEYFPIDVVQREMFNIFETLLGLKFEQIDEKTWSEDVTSYQVKDQKTGELMGFFFMDLFPRQGKYKHAAVTPIQASCRRPDGSRQLSIAALVTNFPKPTPALPGLLTHRQMETFFHEFGHLLHNMCSRTELSAFSGTSVEKDFVEAPSQMLENWLLEPEILKNISSHYQNESKLPDDVINAIIESEYVGLASLTMRQLMLAMYDQELYVNGTNDLNELYRDLGRFYLNITIPENINYPGTFGHLAKSYAGRYYSYLWSEVYSADMFLSTFKKEGILNPKVGHRYRKTVLEKGGTKDAIELLEDFLGRKPSSDAFLKLKRLE